MFSARKNKQNYLHHHFFIVSFFVLSAGVPLCSTACLIPSHPSGVPPCPNPSHGVTADSRQGWNAMQPLPNKKQIPNKAPAGRNPSKARTQNAAVVPRQPHVIHFRIANAEEQRDCLRVIPHHGQGALRTLWGGYRRHNSTNLNKDSHRTSYNTSSCCHNANLTSSCLLHHSGTKTLRDNL